MLVATVRAMLRLRTRRTGCREAAPEWQATFDAIRDGVAMLDSQGMVRRSNAALPRLLRKAPDEIAGRSLDELIPPPAERRPWRYLEQPPPLHTGAPIRRPDLRPHHRSDGG